ncbi:hypothetical protein [uncultured Clostridium sp.]|uniref:hypothetical protein n=1 Tax=uncultured Clostridium sp. TaxID=59620 RepID=UPI002603123D|nr:hypothetical protein [uncultured Clostridium sp.]
MKLKVGMELELIKNLDFGVKIIGKGEVFKIQHISGNKISILNNGIGMGVFELEEIEEYFKEYKNEIEIIETGKDVKRVIYSNKVTVVILNSNVKGVAKCLDEDKYDKKIGYRVAYLKAKIKEMNKELKGY